MTDVNEIIIVDGMRWPRLMAARSCGYLAMPALPTRTFWRLWSRLMAESSIG
jgi:hypothetical protein